MMKIPQQLKKGDTVAIVAPAKAIETDVINYATNFLEDAGFNVKVGKNCLGNHNYFSGTDAERIEDFQTAINDEEVKAIICARGGYGCVRIVDRINWVSFLDQPKWIVGFSDVTVFHQRLTNLGVASLHATMPLNYKDNSKEALTTLVGALTGEKLSYSWSGSTSNKTGMSEGEIVGGNLAVLCGLIGTTDMPDYCDKILFLEEVGEHLYALDRMFYQLEKSGILDQIRGLILGSFSNSKDTEVPFGKTLEEIISAHFQYRNIPIAFDFPAGHIDDNRALKFGKNALFTVTEEKCTLDELDD